LRIRRLRLRNTSSATTSRLSGLRSTCADSLQPSRRWRQGIDIGDKRLQSSCFMLNNAAPQSIVSVKKQLDKVLALKGR
jgi:hypothetical protein